MSEEHDFERCLAIAQHVVSSYRAGAPEGCDPQNTFGLTATQMIVAGAAVVGAGAGIASGIISYNSAQAQAKATSQIAAYNAHQQEFNAKIQLMGMQAQALLQKRQAEAQFRMRQIEAQGRFNNAISIENTVEGQSRSARESIRRKSLESDSAMATARANIAKSNLVESTGSPVAILMEIARQDMMTRESMRYQDQLNRDSLFREAELERFGGKMALAGATLDRNSEVAGAGLQAAAAQAAYQSKLRDAEIIRLSGAAQSQAFKGQAWGSLISGFGNAASSVASGVSGYHAVS
jgi:hypothetical protein